MAEPQSKPHELEALLAERKKYELWLAQLEAKRAGAAERVYARVHADYRARLDAVQAKLADEAGAISALVGKLEARLEREHEQVSEKTDERAESELRAAVGEYSEKEWNAARVKLDAAIAERRGRFDATERELAELKDLLRSVDGEAPPPRASVERRAAEAVAADLAGAWDPPADASEAALAREAADATASAAAIAAVEETTPAADAPASETLAAATDDASGAPDAPAEKSGEPADGAPAEPTFDELAFLRSVAGTPARASAAAAVDETDDAPRPAARPKPPKGRGPIDEPPSRPRASAAATTTAESDEASPLGGPTPRTSQAVRSLKCQECGTLNFPTEWYCERCGGELAAF